MSFDRADFKLTEVAKIEEVTMPIDNLFIDGVGDIYAAAFPKARKLLKSLEDPTINPPSAVWQIRRLEDEFKVTKILEDSDGEVLPGSTVAVHDVKTGRLILGGEF